MSSARDAETNDDVIAANHDGEHDRGVNETDHIEPLPQSITDSSTSIAGTSTQFETNADLKKLASSVKFNLEQPEMREINKQRRKSLPHQTTTILAKTVYEDDDDVDEGSDPENSILEEHEHNQQLVRSPEYIKRQRKHRIACGVLLFLLVLFSVVCCLLLIYKNDFDPSKDKPKSKRLPRNFIFMISDGFGPASATLAREFREFREFEPPLLDKQFLIGMSKTKSASSRVTDSAAGATALSCGIKTNNNFVATTSDSRPCPTWFELARRAGYDTGIVVTSKITDATPASFSSHVLDRNSEAEILLQQLGLAQDTMPRGVDLIFGGGGCLFTRESEGGCRKDDRNIWQELKSKGNSTILRTKADFDELEDEVRNTTSTRDVPYPIIGVFAPGHMSYDIDRHDLEEPSLAQMTQLALDILTKKTANKTDKGFVLLVEGSRIDMAAHSNDPTTHFYEIIQYQDAFLSTHRHVGRELENTAVISVSDHETGGLTLGRQSTKHYPVYQWHPEELNKQTKSTNFIATQVVRKRSEYPPKDFEAWVHRTAFKNYLGWVVGSDSPGLLPPWKLIMEFLSDPNRSVFQIDTFLAYYVSKRANIGWTTHGHTGVDVNLYGFVSRDLEFWRLNDLRGSVDNTEIGKWAFQFLKLNDEKLLQEWHADFQNWVPPDRARDPDDQKNPLASSGNMSSVVYGGDLIQWDRCNINDYH